MGNNRRAGMFSKMCWFKTEMEYERVKEFILNNNEDEKEEALRILSRMIQDGDL